MRRLQKPDKPWYEDKEWPEQLDRAKILVGGAAFMLAPFWVFEELELGFHDGWAVAATIVFILIAMLGILGLYGLMLGGLAVILKYRHRRHGSHDAHRG